MFTLDEKLRPHPDAVDTELDSNEVVLLHLDRKLYYSLNLTGMRIWQGIKQGLSLAEISQRLQQEFKVDSKGTDSSVLRIADELSREKLVEAST
jgi:coenzyme PQQ synthesis protein D (PqqD)